MAFHLSLSVTAALLSTLLLLGLSLQLRWRRDQTRWIHHALFFGVCLALGLTIWLGWRSARAVWALLPSMILLLSMPQTRPGRANHWRRALLVALSFAVGVWLCWS